MRKFKPKARIEKTFDTKQAYQAYKKIALELQPKLKMHPNFKAVFKMLVLYFCNDSGFTMKGYGFLNKGIFLIGEPGVGKTLMMNVFKNNPRTPYEIETTSQVVQACLKKDDKFGYYMISSGLTGFCFDDLGNEPKAVKEHGRISNFMKAVILNRYKDKFTPKYLTHYTSRITNIDEIGKLYSREIHSKMKEWFNIIHLLGPETMNEKYS